MQKTTRSIICRTTVLSGVLFAALQSSAQLYVNPQADLQNMVQSLAGAGVRIENPSIQCHVNGYGQFTYTGSVLGATQGVLLTTGSITNAIGPNNVENKSFVANTPGDALLELVTGRTTYDACRLEFDVIPSGDTISFDFVFGSEEYNEWVGSQFNDVFGFFISGPGIVGDPGAGGEKNIALIPGTTQPVTINEVNNGVNSQYFHDNTGGSQIQYDGFTKHLKAVSAVQPCETYRLKVIIADASDRMFDSGVFIQKIQSNAITMEAFTALGIPTLVEGCNPGHVRFSRPDSDPTPLTISYYIQGTATNGVDYEAIGNTDPNVAKSVTIPAGTTYADVVITPLADGIAEGTEYLRFILGNPDCPGTLSDSLDFPLVDELPVEVTPGNTTICQGGSVAFQASGGASYSWSPAAGLSATNIANPVASPTATTTYTVTITHGACTRTVQRTVTVANMALTAVTTRPLCNGQSNGAINLTVSGGNAPYLYSWTGPNSFTANTEDLVNIPSGTYTVTVTDANDCTKVQSFNVNTPAPLSASATSPVLIYGQNIACHGGTTGSITLTINGGTAPYAVAWTGPNGYSSSSQNISNLTAGTYNATITDTNGCITTTSITLTQPPAMVASIVDVAHVSCHGGSNGSATAEIVGGIPPYSYSWNTAPVQTTATATDLPAGTRTVTITDGYGCQTTASVIIQQPTVLSVSLTGVSHVVQCQGQNNPHGSGTAVPAGGTPPYSYFWNTIPSQTTATAEFNSGGTYNVTVTDANGCTAMTSVTVTQPGTTSLEVTQLTNVTCSGTNTGGASVTITGGSNVQSIVWNTEPPQYGLTISNLPAGTYNAIAQHANGCQSAVTVTIDDASGGALGTPSISGSSSVACYGDGNGSVTLDASGGTAPYTYAYNGLNLPGNELTGLAAGDHLVTVTDANGCTSTGTVTVDGPTAALGVGITGFTNVLCYDAGQGSASALATGGTPPYSYAWNTVPTQTGPEATALEAGYYTVTVTDANGCTASTDVSISGPQYEIYGIIEDFGHVTCHGANDGFATISVWGGSNSFTVTWETQPPTIGLSASGLAPGLYNVVVVDNNGCDTPKQGQIEIQGPASPLVHTLTVSEYNGWNTSCSGANDGWIDLHVNGGSEPYHVTWSDAQGMISNTEDLANIGAGTYYVSISDDYGCTITDTVVITAPQPLELEIALSSFTGGSNVSCAGMADGSAQLTISGGTAPYSIAWSNNQGFSATTAQINTLAAGNYDLLVTDANGCTADTTITLIAHEAIALSGILSMYNGSNVSCANASDGSIDLTIIGGIAPFDILWNTGVQTQDLNGIPAGTYEVIVDDANGCKAIAAYTLLAPEALELNTVVASVSGGYGTSCAGSMDGSITATIGGGTLPYTITWTGPNGFSSNATTINGLSAGNYTITVTDGNSCIASTTAQVTAPAPLNVSINSTTYNGGYHIACHGGSTGLINASVSGGVPVYSIAWNGPDGFTSTAFDLTGLVAGIYEAVVTDANGCSATASITLTAPEAMNADISVSDAGGGYQVSCNANDGSISVIVSGGTADHNFSWNGPGGFGSTSANINGLAAGTYELTIMDANGCIAQHSVTLNAPAPITASFTTTSNACAGGMAASLAVSLNGGGGGFALEWTGPDNFSSTDAVLQGLAGGNYTLNVSDALGCTAIFSTAVLDPAPLHTGTYVSFYGQFNLQCAGDSTGVIELAPTGGTSPYAWIVNGPNGYTSSAANMTQLIAGEYHVSITDQNGCDLDTVITLTQPDQLIDASFELSIYPSGTNVSCFGAADGWIEANVSGGIGPYEFFWRGPDSLEWDMENIYNLTAGNYAYELVIIDANQCTFETEITLTQPASAIHATSTTSQFGDHHVSCAEALDGEIDLTAGGGNGGLTYSWSGPGGFSSNATNLTGLGAGSYIATITDINGCTLDHAVLLTAPMPLQIGLASNMISCFGAEDGLLQADIDGGNGPYGYIWSGPDFSSSEALELFGLPAGTYCLDVVDAQGCMVQECITIQTPALLTASISTTNSDCGSNGGSVDLDVAGGIAPYAYAWSNGAVTQDLIGLQAGIYEVTITDANSCTIIALAEVQGTPGITATASITDIICHGDKNGVIVLEILSGTAPFHISWSNGSPDLYLEDLAAGDHTVSISDANGCTLTQTFTVLQGAGLVLDTMVSMFHHGHNVSHYQGSDGSIGINVSGGNAPYSYSWSTGESNAFINNLPAGTYTVEVTDNNGCAATMVFTLTEPSDLEMPNGYSPNGDGQNDTFIIRGLEAYPGNTFTVFNRWGNVVYDRLNYRNDWRGENSNGQDLPSGTYFVILTVNNGTRTLQGYVDMRR